MTDVKHDYDAAEAAARRFDEQFGKLKEHHSRTSRARTRSVGTRHSDPLARVVADAAGEALGAIEKALDSLAEHSKDVAKGLRKMNENHKELEENLAQQYKKIISEHDTTPVYLMDHHGKVHRVTQDGNLESIKDDDSGIRHFFGDDGNSTRIKASDHKAPPGHARVDSTNIPAGSTELARATQRARAAAKDDGDYGSNTPRDKPKANYAAMHYQDDQGRNFILVARSKWPDLHSEKRIGVPILDKNLGHNVRSLYTERAPCDDTSNSNCGAWVKWRFPHLTDVSHSIDYPGTEAHSDYLSRLRDRHQRIHGR